MNPSFKNQPPSQQQHPLNYTVPVPINFDLTSYPPQNFTYSTFSPSLSPTHHSHIQLHAEDRAQTDNDTGSEQSESEASILFPRFSTNEKVLAQKNCIPSHIAIPWSTFPYQLCKIHQDKNKNNDQINFTSSTTKQRHRKPKIQTGTGKNPNVAVNPNPQKQFKNEKLMHCPYDDFPSANVGNTDINPTMNKCQKNFSNTKYESKSLEKPTDGFFQNTDNFRGPPNSKVHPTFRKFEFPTEYQYNNDNSDKTLNSCAAQIPIPIINSKFNLDSAAVTMSVTPVPPGSKSNYKASTNSNLSTTSKQSGENASLGGLRPMVKKSSPDFKFLFKSNRQIKSIPYYRDCIDDENNGTPSSIISTVKISQINLEQKETSNNRDINQAIEPHVFYDLSQYLKSHLGDYECDSFTNAYSGSDFKNEDYNNMSIRNQEKKTKALKNINISSPSKNRNVGNKGAAGRQDLLAEIFTHSHYHPQAGGSYVVEVASIKNNSNNFASPRTNPNHTRKHSILKNGGIARHNSNINNDRIARKLMLPVGAPAKHHGHDLYSKQAKKQTLPSPSLDKCGQSLNHSVKKIPFTPTSPTPRSFQRNIKISPKQTTVVFQKKHHPHREQSCIASQDPRHQSQSQSQAHSSTKYYSPEIPPQSRGCDEDQTSARQSPDSSCNSPTDNSDHSRSPSPLTSPNIEGTNHTHHGYQRSPNNLNTSQPQWNAQVRGSHCQNQTSCPCPCPCSSPRANNCCYYLAANNRNECSAPNSNCRGQSQSLSPPRYPNENNHCSNSNRPESGYNNQCGSIQNHSTCNRLPHNHCHNGCSRACNYTFNLTNCKPQCPDSKNASDNNCIRNEGRQRNPDTQRYKHCSPTSDRTPPHSSRGCYNNHQGGRPPSAGNDYCSSRSRREESKTRIPSTTPCRSVDNATWTRSRKATSGSHHGPPRLPLRPDRKSGHCYSSRRLSYCDPSCNDNKGDSGCPFTLKCEPPCYDPCPCPEQYYPCREPYYELPPVPYIPMPSPPSPYPPWTPVGSPPMSLEWYPSCSVTQCSTPPILMPPPPDDCFESPCEDPIIPPTPPVPMLVVPLPPPPRPRVFHRKVRKRIKPYKDIDYAVQPRKTECPIFDCCGCDCCPNLRSNQVKLQDQFCDYAQGECQEYWC